MHIIYINILCHHSLYSQIQAHVSDEQVAVEHVFVAVHVSVQTKHVSSQHELQYPQLFPVEHVLLEHVFVEQVS